MEDNNNIVEETRLKVNKIEKYKEEANNCKKNKYHNGIMYRDYNNCNHLYC